MRLPLVTVFIPVYNCGKYISQTLDSILEQTYKNIEVILVDDGSTDDSINIIQSFNDSRIRLITNEKNMGIPYTRNVGLKEAKGEYLVIMDSDDIAVLHRIEVQVKYMENNKNIDAAGSHYIKFTNNSSRKIKSSNFTSSEAIKIMLLFFCPIANPSSIVRMATVRKHNLTYNLNHFVSQDYGFWAQLSKVGKLSIIPEYLLKYRSGHENITKKSKRDKTEKRKDVIKSIQEDLIHYYGIEFTMEERLIFHEFFSYNYSSINNLNSIINVINTLRKWNRDTNTFNSEIFEKVLNDSVLTGITNQKITLMKKWKLCLQTISKKKFRRFIYIFIKHSYHKIRNY